MEAQELIDEEETEPDAQDYIDEVEENESNALFPGWGEWKTLEEDMNDFFRF